jgi:cephalosporin hydroxylase
MFDRDKLEADKRKNAASQFKDSALQKLGLDFTIATDRHGYAYQWTWLGMPIIQMPPDIIAMQEVIWENRPDVIIETGIAWGGSTVLHASVLELIGSGRIIAVDITLPENNIEEIMKYPFSRRIQLLCGSSIDEAIVEKIRQEIKPGEKVMVVLDSNHSHEHVLGELRAYGPLVTRDQMMVVGDTIIADLPEYPDRPRPWNATRNPRSALEAYLKECDRFERDAYINDKLLFTYFPDAFLRCVK